MGVGAIARDLLALNLHNQLGVRAYFQYRLFDPRIPYPDKKDYIPDSGRATRRLWSLLTPVQYRLPFRNKLVFNRLFGGQGLPVARVFGVYDPRIGFTVDGEELRNAADLRRWMSRAPDDGFVFKALYGIEDIRCWCSPPRGRRSCKLHYSLGGPLQCGSPGGVCPRTRELERHGAWHPDSYLIEERIRPHPVMAELVGPTLCCCRVVTFIGRNGNPQILGAVYKIQPEPLGVDHLSYGAVGSWVDLESGALGPGRSRHHFGYTSVIPGTDKTFVGFKLPHWPQIKEVALKAARVLPWARAIGWDIAIAIEGQSLSKEMPSGPLHCFRFRLGVA